MKSSLFFVSVTILLAVAAVGQEKPVSKEATISGEVIDVACYLAAGARGADHIECGKACAKAGGSLGILTADGRIYVSLLPDDHKNNPNHLLIDHVGHNVDAKGYVRVKGGVNGIMIRSVTMAKN